MVDPKCSNCNTISGFKLKAKVTGFEVWFCSNCQIGATLPTPKDLSKFYPKNYWSGKSLADNLKLKIYKFFQKRRKNWIEKYLSSGSILDVGAGEGEFSKSFNGQFTIFNVEAPWAKLKNKQVLKVDFLKWEPSQKFDAITFWESLEHTPSPRKYLEKAYKLLKGGGLVFIEYPRFNCLESCLFGRFWYHLDLPRHLSHMTDEGIEIILRETNFKIVHHQPVLAFEYTPAGFFASILNWLGADIHILNKKPLLLFLTLVVLSPVLMVSILVELILGMLNLSPIGLVIASKAK